MDWQTNLLIGVVILILHFFDNFFTVLYLKKIENLEQDLLSLPFKTEALKASDFLLSSEHMSPEINDFIQKYEWLGSIGTIPKWCFTARYQNTLSGVVLINEPTAYSRLLGEDTGKYEALIQRGATASWTPKNLGSRLIMYSCRWMVSNTDKRLFVAYGDPMANELGIIYQACGFDYLGADFGNNYLYRHPGIKRDFSSQTLKRTSMFKQWCRNQNVSLQDEWFNENGFKNVKRIPLEIKQKWHDWNKQILIESEKIKINKKHKYALLMGKNKSERKKFFQMKQYLTLPYPKKASAI
jgi:hypothetical protein